MRKVLQVTMLATMMLLTSFTANAQLKFGLKGGLNVTSMSFNKEVFDASNRTGFFIGPTVKFSLPIGGLGIDAAALYDQRSAQVSDGTYSEDIKQKQIAIPVNLRYNIGLSSLANIFVFAGPQWGINVGDEDFSWKSGSSYSLKKSNFSVNLGAGFTVLSHLQISANYNIACGKTADATWSSVASDITKARSHNNSWQIAAAYYF